VKVCTTFNCDCFVYVSVFKEKYRNLQWNRKYYKNVRTHIFTHENSPAARTQSTYSWTW